MLNNSYEEPTAQTSSTDELEKLFELKERGVITEEEYQKKKSELL